MNPGSSLKTCLDTYKNLYDKNFHLQTQSRKKSKQRPWMTKELNNMRKTTDRNKIKVTKGILDEKEYKEHKNKTRGPGSILQGFI